MSSDNQRILLHILMSSGNDAEATKKVDTTYLRLNNILAGDEQLPNIANICACCNNVNTKLGAYIRNRCLNIRKEDTIFEPSLNNPNNMLNAIENSNRKNIRVLLYPGKRNDIDNLNLSETTHSMIIQFDQSQTCFRAAVPHAKYPSFYQTCNSDKNAILYLEGLIVDACICHYLGVSDVALHHDNKQRISLEKVTFLRELAERQNISFLSPNAQVLVKHVVTKLSNDTPYISFLSIFTIAPMDIFKDESYDFFSYFEDYCNLWSKFQKWYFDKYGRVFSKNKKVINPLETVFDRNKYQGQISPVEISNKIDSILNTSSKKISNAPFGLELRYAVIIIKHMPDTHLKTQQFEALFPGQLHQAKWDIIYWGDISRYNNILPYLEIVPFMIIDN